MKPTHNINDSLKRIEQTYEQVKSALDSKLLPNGYQILEEKYHPETFGSRYAVWSNTMDAIRLLWDGRDELFCLQTLDSMPVDWKDDWKDLIYVSYDPRKHDFSYVQDMRIKIADSLG